MKQPLSRQQWAALCAVLLNVLPLARSADAASVVSGLKADARDGQVFLTWREADMPEGTTFNVYCSAQPITDVAAARQVAHHIEQHSARDWWEDPASFTKGKPHAEPVGFLIDGRRLDPRGGLLVHTPQGGGAARLYFVVTCTDPAGKEDPQLTPGENSLADGVLPAPGPIRPLWQGTGKQPQPGAGRGKGLWLNLHAKSGVVSNMEYLFFGDATMGWREGLAVKFSVRVEGDEVVVRPTDRVWINRPHIEAADAGSPAIWTFWYGYNSKIFDRPQMGQGIPTNYTERLNLWILNWARNYYQPDPSRWYCSGSSMGGCGTVSFGLRHPELFAGLHANVPIVAYTYLGRASATRLEPSCWTGKIPADLKTNEGVSLLERMDGTKFVRETRDDLPMMLLIHGRRDNSIPWQNNPPFYRAMQDAHQAFAVYWDNGDHATCGKDAPADVKAWTQRFRRLRHDESYPAFSNTSSDRKPGDGRPDNGDIVGWINRGMDWKQIDDQPDHYAITVLADYPGVEYPVRTDVTLRRLQRFKPKPGDQVPVRVGDEPPISAAVDARGTIQIPHVSVSSKAGVRIVVTGK